MFCRAREQLNPELFLLSSLVQTNERTKKAEKGSWAHRANMRLLCQVWTHVPYLKAAAHSRRHLQDTPSAVQGIGCIVTQCKQRARYSAASSPRPAGRRTGLGSSIQAAAVSRGAAILTIFCKKTAASKQFAKSSRSLKLKHRTLEFKGNDSDPISK